MNMYKNELIKSGWYDDIIKDIESYFLLEDMTDKSYPIMLTPINNEIRERVYGYDLVKEAELLLKIIKYDNSDYSVNLDNLTAWIRSNTEILLHNYTIELSHRKFPSVSIEEIRKNLVILSILNDLQFNQPSSLNEPFYICEDWYRNNEYYNSLKERQ